MKHSTWHAIWVATSAGAVVVLANALSNMSDIFTSHPVTFKAIVVGVLTGAVSRGLGAYIGSKPSTPQP